MHILNNSKRRNAQDSIKIIKLSHKIREINNRSWLKNVFPCRFIGKKYWQIGRGSQLLVTCFPINGHVKRFN